MTLADAGWPAPPGKLPGGHIGRVGHDRRHRWRDDAQVSPAIARRRTGRDEPIGASRRFKRPGQSRYLEDTANARSSDDGAISCSLTLTTSAPPISMRPGCTSWIERRHAAFEGLRERDGLERSRARVEGLRWRGRTWRGVGPPARSPPPWRSDVRVVVRRGARPCQHGAPVRGQAHHDGALRPASACSAAC